MKMVRIKEICMIIIFAVMFTGCAENHEDKTTAESFIEESYPDKPRYQCSLFFTAENDNDLIVGEGGSGFYSQNDVIDESVHKFYNEFITDENETEYIKSNKTSYQVLEVSWCENHEEDITLWLCTYYDGRMALSENYNVAVYKAGEGKIKAYDIDETSYKEFYNTVFDEIKKDDVN